MGYRRRARARAAVTLSAARAIYSDLARGSSRPPHRADGGSLRAACAALEAAADRVDDRGCASSIAQRSCWPRRAVVRGRRARTSIAAQIDLCLSAPAAMGCLDLARPRAPGCGGAAALLVAPRTAAASGTVRPRGPIRGRELRGAPARAVRSGGLRAGRRRVPCSTSTSGAHSAWATSHRSISRAAPPPATSSRAQSRARGKPLGTDDLPAIGWPGAEGGGRRGGNRVRRRDPPRSPPGLASAAHVRRGLLSGSWRPALSVMIPCTCWRPRCPRAPV